MNQSLPYVNQHRVSIILTTVKLIIRRVYNYVERDYKRIKTLLHTSEYRSTQSAGVGAVLKEDLLDGYVTGEGLTAYAGK
jgi:hypothetical protein